MRLKLTVIGALAAAGLAAGLLAGVASATYPGTNNGRLAFAIDVGGNVDIYSVFPNGNDLRRLTDADSGGESPHQQRANVSSPRTIPSRTAADAATPSAAALRSAMAGGV
jgi:hypothetical protein